MIQRIGALFVALASASLASSWIGTSVGPTVPSQAALGEHQHRLNGSYYNVAEFGTTLVLNNKGSDPVRVEARVFDLRGNGIDLRPLQVPGNQFIKMDMGEALQGLPKHFDQGSIELRYWGRFLQLDAQLRLADESNGLGFAEQLVRPEEFKSSELRGNWWLPHIKSRMIWILSNTSETNLSLEGTLSGTSNPGWLKSLILRGHETRVIKADPLAVGGLINIAHDGEPGDLIVRGIVLEPRSNYSSVIECIDPDRAETSELHGVGLRVGPKASPVLSLANHANKACSASVSLTVRTDGNVREVPFADVSIEAGGIKTFDNSLFEAVLANAGLNDETEAGIRVRYTAAPGSVTGYAASLMGDQGILYRVPLLDAGAHFSSAGTYPWDLQDDQDTIFYVANLTSQPQMQHYYLTSQKEIVHFSGFTTLQPGESIAVDIARLRDQQEIDQDGRTVPLDAINGQIHWSVLGTEVGLDARIEQIDRSLGGAASFDCRACCNDLVFTEPLPSSTDALDSSTLDSGAPATSVRLTAVDSQGNLGPVDLVGNEALSDVFRSQALDPTMLTPVDHPGTSDDGNGTSFNPYRAGDRILLEMSPKPDSVDLSLLTECCNSPVAYLFAYIRTLPVKHDEFATCGACGPMFQNAAVDFQSGNSGPGLLAYDEPQRENNYHCKVSIQVFGQIGPFIRVWEGSYFVKDDTPDC